MGGLGSGQWDRWDKRMTLDALGRLDVRRLHQQGSLDGAEHWLWVRAAGGVAVEPWGRERQVIPLAWTRVTMVALAVADATFAELLLARTWSTRCRL